MRNYAEVVATSAVFFSFVPDGIGFQVVFVFFVHRLVFFLPGHFLVNLRNGFCDEWGRQLRHYVKLRNGCGDQEGRENVEMV